MDYKEKYEIAIERLRNAFYSNNSRMCDEYRKAVVEIIEPIFPELKEFEDEKIRKALINGVECCKASGWTNFGNNVDIDVVLAWLEKQGDKKEDVTRAKIAEYLKKLILDQSQRGAHMLDYEGRIEEEVDFIIGIAKKELKNEKQGEQRFKVEKDKWYVCVSQFLNCIKGRCYKATSDGRIIDDYGTEYDMHVDAYRWFRPWSIEDAKPGDVLSFNDGHGNDCIELVKSITDKKIEFWFCLTNGNSYEVFGGITPYTNLVSRENATPATKEQRNQLEKAMADAGYIFDFEKKELKKIEHKEEDKTSVIVQNEEVSKTGFVDGEACTKEEMTTTWSEEDIIHFRRCLGYIEAYVTPRKDDVEWFKSLKDRVQPQPKQEWSEDEEDLYAVANSFMPEPSWNVTIETEEEGSGAFAYDYNQMVNMFKAGVNWFKSLRPKSQWRPSDEQMKIFRDLIEVNNQRFFYLKSLYNDLKKLKEN